MSKTPKSKIGIVGCGAIGAGIARAIDSGVLNATMAGVCDVDASRADAMCATFPRLTVLSLEELVKTCDIAVECAHVSAVESVAALCLAHGRDLIVMSVGGLTTEIIKRFEEGSANLYIPSGAVCGIDGVLASSLGDIQSITLTTRKPPAGLAGAPYIEEKGISLDDITCETVVFEGSPADAIKGFPKNVNVSTTLALASGAAKNFTVRIVADPASSGNIHEVELQSSLGNIHLRVENVPSQENPKTSALAYYSVIALLIKILSRVKIGT